MTEAEMRKAYEECKANAKEFANDKHLSVFYRNAMCRFAELLGTFSIPSAFNKTEKGVNNEK